MRTIGSKVVSLLPFFLCILVGCSTADVSLLKVGPDGRGSYEDTFVFTGGLSSETVNLLGNHLLNKRLQDDPEQCIRDLEALCRTDRSTRIYIALAETSQMLASSMRSDPDAAAKYDLTTLLYTQEYFKHIIRNPSNRLFDPEVIIAVKCYNRALTELFAYLRERGLHTAGTFELTAAGGQVMHFDQPGFDLPVSADKIEDILLCADFRPEGLTHDSRKFGVGVPLVCDLADDAIPETVFSERQVIPATLACYISAPEDSGRRRIKLYYADSRSHDDVVMNGVSVPLAQDFSTPLAYMVKDPPPFSFLQRTFLIDKTRHVEGLYHLEPHHDNRIPIVLVHGLMSDMRTWLQLINTLQSDDELRKNYRFMGFSYSSGNPIFITAMHLRHALAQERQKLQKDGHSLEKFDRMVLIGHSMGGLISRIVISRSDDEILGRFVGEKVYRESIERNDPEFREVMIFEPAPMVKRVIFIAVPHRGSVLAQSMIGQVASSMIQMPKSLIEFNARMIRQVLKPGDSDAKIRAIEQFNGIDNLSPDGAALRLLNRMPMADIPIHSVIGNQEKQGVPGGSDGVVAYSSSHLDRASSETVVHSGHSVQQNALAIQEIKRILKEHLISVKKDEKGK